MTITWLYTLISIIGVSLLSLLGALTLFFSPVFLKRSIFILVSIAVGALFGDVFIHIFPETFKALPVGIVSSLILVGILLFFILEKFLHWHHDHIEECDECDEKNTHIEPVGYMTLISDTVHNFIDGLIIGSSFLVNPSLGFATTLAVVFHEIPQEIGHFGLLIHAGFSRGRALWLNFISALSAILGGVVALMITFQTTHFVDYVLPITAGGFIYIAGSDLVPELHKTRDPKKSIIQLIAIMAGFGIMFALLAFE